MQDLLFTGNAVLPIVLMTALGYLLKKLKVLTTEFLDVGNKLTYRILLPILLFYNVYNIEDFSAVDWSFVLYGLVGIVVVFALAIPLYCVFTKDNGQRGALIQSAFRSNYAIIGIPLATALFGQAGAAAASLMSAFTIPLFNALAVVTLSVFNKKEEKAHINVGKILLGIVKNPLIIGVVSGLAVLGIRALLNLGGITFRLTDVGFLYSAIRSLGAIATPLALIVLGGQFQFSSVKTLWRPILLGTVVRTVIVPAAALLLASVIFQDPAGEYYATYVAVFGTPVAVSSAVLAKEMDSDYELAGQLVVWTTIASSITVFVIILILRLLNIF